MLASDDVAVPRQVDFLRLTPRFDVPLVQSQDRTAHFRTISYFAPNVTISPWVTDKWVMLPFWLANWESAPFGYLPSTSQTWRVNTTVFKNEHSCSNMTLEDISAKVITDNMTTTK
jgi:hypothetical protein